MVAIWYGYPSYLLDMSAGSTTNSAASITYAVTTASTNWTTTSSSAVVWYSAPPVETAEQRRTRLEREAAERARVEQERRERLAANARAKELLLGHLTPEQRRTFRRNGWFVVEGQSGRRYELATASHAGNIHLMDDHGARVEQLCCHPSAAEVPLLDSILTQKLMLEGDEEAFRRTANITPLRAA